MSREYFTQLGITQLALAAHIGVSVQRVDEFVRGNRGVTPETAWRSFSQRRLPGEMTGIVHHLRSSAPLWAAQRSLTLVP